jgi:hypothetical protein
VTSLVPDLRMLNDVGSSCQEGMEEIDEREATLPDVLARQGCRAKPGTVEKLVILARRRELGLPLEHKDDYCPEDPSGYAYCLPEDMKSDEEL